MVVLSTFNGIGCIWLALDRLGVTVTKRYVSEIDKYANIINDKNYSDTIHLGDVTQVSAKKLGKVDLLVGGSPCQGFSFAGKQLNFEDPRSKLFFEFVRLWEEVKEANPEAKFLLENVRMKKEYQDVISQYLGVEPIEINSSLVSAQNRRRLYWTNILGIEQPQDKGILLNDILIRDFSEDYYLTDNQILRCIEKYKAKVYPSGNRMGNMKFPQDIFKKAKTLCALHIPGRELNMVKVDKFLTVKRFQGKSSTLTAGGNSGGNHSDMDLLLSLSGRMRRLTPIECERLQTVPDNYTEGVSDTQRYKLLGNGWTIDVIVCILSPLFNKVNELDLFGN